MSVCGWICGRARTHVYSPTRHVHFSSRAHARAFLSCMMQRREKNRKIFVTYHSKNWKNVFLREKGKLTGNLWSKLARQSAAYAALLRCARVRLRHREAVSIRRVFLNGFHTQNYLSLEICFFRVPKATQSFQDTKLCRYNSNWIAIKGEANILLTGPFRKWIVEE